MNQYYFYFENKKYLSPKDNLSVSQIFEICGIKQAETYTLAQKTKKGFREFESDAIVDVHQNVFCCFDKKPTYNA